VGVGVGGTGIGVGGGVGGAVGAGLGTAKARPKGSGDPRRAVMITPAATQAIRTKVCSVHREPRGLGDLIASEDTAHPLEMWQNGSTDF
jgi:hypothetical protein